MAADQLSVVFGALADPTRRAILARLTSGDANVAELAAPFRMSQPAVSRHLKVLEQAGLISRTPTRRRPGSVTSRPSRCATRREWLARYREYWDESYDRLDALLAALQSGQVRTPPPSQRTRRRANHDHDQTIDRGAGRSVHRHDP